ncbi:glycosyltransferase family 2 protein, partial [Bradyrhizobium sp.]|uniref:glycosyltransferase n=1 Tax=Bradyrhizobium sp. TaxID=376 RepID=UPI003C6AAF10
HYTNRRYGWGLLPQDYLAFKTQRARWAGGAVQIVKKHWRRFLPGMSLLDHDQKREFVFGWLSWFGSEIVAVAAALLNLIWVPFVVFQIVAIPDPLLLLPSIAAFLVSLLHFVSAYRKRVAIPYPQMLGAMVVFMSLQWTVARSAFEAALPARKSYFHRTRKGGGGTVRGHFAAIPEAVLGALLVTGGLTVFATNFYRLLGTDLFATILVIQSLPFLSAVALAGLERLRGAEIKPGLPS